MDEAAAKAIADRTIASVFGFQNPYDLHGVLEEKFTFDIRLPKQLQDHYWRDYVVSINTP